MNQKNKQQLSEFETANNINVLVTSPVTIFRVWGFYLFSEEFKEQGLRRNLFLIWVMSLRDIVEGWQRDSDALLNMVNFYNNKNLCEGYNQLSSLTNLTFDFFDNYSREEQIFLGYMRDQRVHSWSKNYSLSHSVVKWIENKKLNSDSIPWNELEKTIKPYAKENFSNSVTNLYKRCLDTKLLAHLKQWASSDEPERFTELIFQGLSWNGQDPVQSVWKG